MKRQKEIAQILLEILEEPITDKSINDIINSEDITDMGITSHNMVMFIVELENKYDCTIDITQLCTKDMLTIKSATKPFNVLLACTRPLSPEFADNLRLKHPLQPTISPYPTIEHSTP